MSEAPVIEIVDTDDKILGVVTLPTSLYIGAGLAFVFTSPSNETVVFRYEEQPLTIKPRTQPNDAKWEALKAWLVEGEWGTIEHVLEKMKELEAEPLT